MPKLTITDLKTITQTWLDESLVAREEFTPSAEAITGLLDKIGKQVNIDYSYKDMLQLFDGEELPLGKTVEEWFADAFLPVDFDEDGALSRTPTLPTYQKPVYSYKTQKKTIRVTEKFARIESACISTATYSDLIASIAKRMGESKALTKYYLKLRLLELYIQRVNEDGYGTQKIILMASDPLTDVSIQNKEQANDFILKVKKEVEKCRFPREDASLNGNLTQVSEDGLVLLIAGGIVPTIEVETLSSSINSGNLKFPVEVVVATNESALYKTASDVVIAMLIDRRALRLFTASDRYNSDTNGSGDFITYYNHLEFTPHASPNAVAIIFTKDIS